MFSDFKTRGFGLEDSHLQRHDRMARLILVMALALFWAVSTGMWDAVHHATPDEKRFRHASLATSAAAWPRSSSAASAASRPACNASFHRHRCGVRGRIDGWQGAGPWVP